MGGRGYITVLIGKGRETNPFPHGRGVRQGSVGGPLKWIVFMNFWLQWVKKEREGEGYVMKGGGGQMTVEEAWGEREWAEKVEVIGQMFVDDSMWFAKNEQSMQNMIDMHEAFCEFHGLQLNKDKCEHVAMNKDEPCHN